MRSLINISDLSVEEVKEKIEKEEAEAGFVINSLTQYDYYVYDGDFFPLKGQNISVQSTWTFLGI